MTQPVKTIDVLLAEHAELERALADPDLHSNPAEARTAGRRFARLAPIVGTHRKLVSALGDLETARELAADDESFVDEVAELESRVAELDTQLTDMLSPRDPHDADDIVLEVKSGEGGEESALFAADLARMYIRYAERHGLPMTLDELQTHALIGRAEYAAGIPALLGRSWRFAFSSSSDVALLGAVRAGLGIGACQTGVARAEPDLLPVMPDTDLVTVPIWLAMHEDRRVLRRVRLLFDHLAVQLKAYVDGAPR